MLDMLDNQPTAAAIVCDRCHGPLHEHRIHDRRLGMMGDLHRFKATIACTQCRAALSGTGPTEADAVGAAIRRWQDRQAASTAVADGYDLGDEALL